MGSRVGGVDDVLVVLRLLRRLGTVQATLMHRRNDNSVAVRTNLGACTIWCNQPWSWTALTNKAGGLVLVTPNPP